MTTSMARLIALSLAPRGTPPWRPFDRGRRPGRRAPARRDRARAGPRRASAVLDELIAAGADERRAARPGRHAARGRPRDDGGLARLGAASGSRATRRSSRACATATPEYLDATVKEVLRTRPVLSITPRKVVAPFDAGGWTLPPGVHVTPCPYLAHRRPELWADPTAFRPERFLAGAPEPYAWLPFGGGVRRCVGAAFATMELHEVLRAVVAPLRPASGPARRRADAPARRDADAVARRSCRAGRHPLASRCPDDLAVLPPQPHDRELPDLLEGAGGRAAREGPAATRRDRAARPRPARAGAPRAQRGSGSLVTRRLARADRRRLPQPARPRPARDRRRGAARRGADRSARSGSSRPARTRRSRPSPTVEQADLARVPARARRPRRPRAPGRGARRAAPGLGRRRPTSCRSTRARSPAYRPWARARRLAGGGLHRRGRLVAAAPLRPRLRAPRPPRLHARAALRPARRRSAPPACYELEPDTLAARRRGRRRDAGGQAARCSRATGCCSSAARATSPPRASVPLAALDRGAGAVGRPGGGARARPRSCAGRHALRPRAAVSGALRPRASRGRGVTWLVLGCLALAALAHLLPAAPTYDPWAWIIWGREIAERDLDTRTGPSWKPLPVLFTTPFALAGDRWAPELWLVVAQAGGLLAFAFTFRLARRLAGSVAGLDRRGRARCSPTSSSATSRAATPRGCSSAFCLWAIERHLDGHRRQAFLLGVGAGPAAAGAVAVPARLRALADVGRPRHVAARDRLRRRSPGCCGSCRSTSARATSSAPRRARASPNPDSRRVRRPFPFVETFRRSSSVLMLPMLRGRRDRARARLARPRPAAAGARGDRARADGRRRGDDPGGLRRQPALRRAARRARLRPRRRRLGRAGARRRAPAAAPRRASRWRC